MGVKRVGAVVAVLPLAALAACAFSPDYDSFTRGSSDGGATTDGGSLDGAKVTNDGGGSVVDGGVDAQTYQDLIRADKPIAYFTFDEPPGSTTLLESITGAKSTVQGNGYAFGIAGIAGTAMQSDGNGEINFGQLVAFTGEQAWTFEAWIYPKVEDGRAFYEYYNKRDSNGVGIVVYVRNENGVTAQLEDNWGDGARGVSVGLPTLDHFIHIVFTYLPGTGVRGWADGFKGNLGYDADGGPATSIADCHIASGVEGTIDEMAVYNYALSDDQIATHYAEGRKH